MNTTAKALAILVCTTLASLCMQAQITPTATYEYVKRDSSLCFDLYKTANSAENYTVIFVFGGGFIGGSRTEPYYNPYFSKLVENNINVIAIDYRLGLKGVKGLGAFNYKPLEIAIDMAVEDLLTATKYIMDYEKDLQIDSKKLIIAGSSAGAITVLQADYELCNRTKLGQILPEDFRYAGVMSFAGAIFSTKGKVKYRHHQPAPTMMLHGTEDKLVNYKQIKVFNVGFFGSSKLVKRFEKYEYPYYMVRFNNLGHEVAARMFDDFEKSMWFIENYIVKGKNIYRDDFIDDRSIKRQKFGSAKPSDLY